MACIDGEGSKAGVGLSEAPIPGAVKTASGSTVAVSAPAPTGAGGEWWFLVQEIGTRNALALTGAVGLMSVLDLAGIAIVFPFLKVVAEPAGVPAFFSRLGLPGAFLASLDHGRACLVLGSALVIFYVVKTLVQVALVRAQSRILARFTEELTNELVARVLSARYAVFQESPASQMAGMAYSNTVHASIALSALSQIMNEGLLLLLLLAALLLVNPVLAAAAVVLALLLAAALASTVLRRVSRLGAEQTAVENVRYRLLFSIASAIRDIKIMGLERVFSQRSGSVSRAYAEIAWRYAACIALPRLTIEFVAFVTLVAGCLGVVLLDVPFTTAGPALGAAALAALRVAPALTKISAAVNSFKFSLPFVTRLVELKDRLSRAAAARVDDGLLFSRSIELRNVGFRYADKPVLAGVTLEVRRNEAVGIVGPSGAGKSTLLDLFTGLQQASEGVFLCDGIPYDPFTSESMRRLVGYVPQAITLFDDTIAFNVSFEERPDPERVVRALTIANLQPLVQALPEGVETVVGENGLRLSGGQRQRLGIARALYRSPGILVFDEATSSLDPATESELAAEIGKLRASVSVVVVAHRLSTVSGCERIYVLADGTIEASGSHAQLLASSPTYRRLFASESGG